MSRRAFGTLLAVVGVLLLADVALAVTWREPVTALLASRDAGRLPAQLDATTARLDHALAGHLDAAVAPRARMAIAATTLARSVVPGDALGTISIPKIDGRFTIVQGTAPTELRGGPGHYLATALPGQHGTVGLAGHRTTYLQPFRHIDLLRRGDQLVVQMPYGRFTYVVSRSQIIAPSQVSVLAASTGVERLVLTACHPLFSAAQRLVVTARLVAAVPQGAARG